jgi:hypothetical protein
MLNLQETLKNAILSGMNDTNNFDEFQWFNTLGIPEITYTPAELLALKVEYIEKNLLELYEIDEIVIYGNTQEGLPLFVTNLTFDEKIAAGYRADKGAQVTQRSELMIEIVKTLDTKAPNAYTVSAKLRRV